MARRITATLAAGAAVLTALALGACSSSAANTAGETSGGGKSLHIYAWADEIPDQVVAAFEKQTGIKVTVDTFTDNETMQAKLAAGGSGYDLVEPSQYTVEQLIAQKLIAPLDHSRLKGLDNPAPKFRNTSYDPGDKYSVPWVWGTTGLAYNDTCYSKPVTSWKALFDPAKKGKLYMLDNMLSAYIVGLQVNGYHANSTSQSEIDKATTTLLNQKSLLAGYNSTNYPQLLSSGQACAAEAYSGSAVAKVVASNSHVHYIIPSEGGTVWTDALAIPSSAKNITSAYAFLNFTLQPKIAAMATNDGSLASTNQVARQYITDKSLLSNAAVYAPDADIAKADFILDPGNALRYFQQGWTKIRAA